MIVYLLEDQKDLALLLSRIGGQKNLRCLFLQDVLSSSEDLLAVYALRQVPLPAYDKNAREKWLAAYVKALGEVNCALHSRLWWATDFSSRNRFNSRLPELVQKLLSIVQVTRQSQDDLIVCSVPWQLRESIKGFLDKEGFVCQAKFSPWVRLWDTGLAFWKRSVGGVFHFFRLLSRFLYVRFVISEKLQVRLQNQQPYYAIKTFVYDHSFAKDGTYKDVFFGQLPKFLEGKGERVIFFANILGDFKSCVAKISACPNALIVPVEYFETLGDIFSAAWDSFVYRAKVTEKVFLGEHDICELVNAELVSSGKIQPYQNLHFAQTKALLKKISAKFFLLTYENNPWEKMCLLALRQFAPYTKVIGYQHTVTPQASVNMFISAQEEAVIPKPDCVLTVGSATKHIIERYTQISSLPVKAACALRYENLWQLAPLPRTKTFQVLLALDGIVEVSSMVNYVIDQLYGKCKYKIIIRTHPVLPVHLIAHKLIRKLSELPFIEVSSGYTPMQDIERTDMTIYWGSTVALESLWVGKPVINFDRQTLFSYDPLFDCSFLKWTVNSRHNLVEVFEEIYAFPHQSFLADRQKAHEYLQEYFYPVSPVNLAPFLF